MTKSFRTWNVVSLFSTLWELVVRLIAGGGAVFCNLWMDLGLHSGHRRFGGSCDCSTAYHMENHTWLALVAFGTSLSDDQILQGHVAFGLRLAKSGWYDAEHHCTHDFDTLHCWLYCAGDHHSGSRVEERSRDGAHRGSPFCEFAHFHVDLELQFVSLDSTADMFFPLMQVKPALVFFFLPIGIVISIGLMNLVTAVLVEKALAAAAEEAEIARIQVKNKVEGCLTSLAWNLHGPRPGWKWLYYQGGDSARAFGHSTPPGYWKTFHSKYGWPLRIVGCGPNRFVDARRICVGTVELGHAGCTYLDDSVLEVCWDHWKMWQKRSNRISSDCPHQKGSNHGSEWRERWNHDDEMSTEGVKFQNLPNRSLLNDCS